MCANEYAYLGKLCAQMNHILSKMCSNVLPPFGSLRKQEYMFEILNKTSLADGILHMFVCFFEVLKVKSTIFQTW